MKKIFKLLLSTIIILLLSFSTFSDLDASSFKRKKKKVPKSDLYYGKNWSKMDADLDKRIDGPNARKKNNNNNKKTEYRRKRSRNGK